MITKKKHLLKRNRKKQTNKRGMQQTVGIKEEKEVEIKGGTLTQSHYHLLFLSTISIAPPNSLLFIYY